MRIEYEAASPLPIVRVEFALNDGEPPKVITFPASPGTDGRFFRGLRFKPTINGSFLLTIRAFDSGGRTESVTCSTPITVTF